uniref:Uncharacterized protein n=1 Tax=Gasterosteus aculeatus TaxID=69293 RepID=G3P7Z4_GASAC
MLPPVSLGEKRGLLVFLFRMLVKGLVFICWSIHHLAVGVPNQLLRFNLCGRHLGSDVVLHGVKKMVGGDQ